MGKMKLTDYTKSIKVEPVTDYCRVHGTAMGILVSETCSVTNVYDGKTKSSIKYSKCYVYRVMEIYNLFYINFNYNGKLS